MKPNQILTAAQLGVLVGGMAIKLGITYGNASLSITISQ